MAHQERPVSQIILDVADDDDETKHEEESLWASIMAWFPVRFVMAALFWMPPLDIASDVHQIFFFAFEKWWLSVPKSSLKCRNQVSVPFLTLVSCVLEVVIIRRWLSFAASVIIVTTHWRFGVLFAALHPPPSFKRILIMYTPGLLIPEFFRTVAAEENQEDEPPVELEEMKTTKSGVKRPSSLDLTKSGRIWTTWGSFYKLRGRQMALRDRILDAAVLYRRSEGRRWAKLGIVLKFEFKFFFLAMVYGPIFIVEASRVLAGDALRRGTTERILDHYLYNKVLTFVEGVFESLPQLVLQGTTFMVNVRAGNTNAPFHGISYPVMFAISCSLSTEGVLQAIWNFYYSYDAIIGILRPPKDTYDPLRLTAIHPNLWRLNGPQWLDEATGLLKTGKDGYAEWIGNSLNPRFDQSDWFAEVCFLRTAGGENYKTNAEAIFSQHTPGAGWEIKLNQDSKIAVVFITNDEQYGASHNELESSLETDSGTWTHVFVVYKSLTKRLLLYVNGTLAGDRELVFGTFIPSPSPTLLGKSAFDDDTFFSGYIAAARAHRSIGHLKVARVAHQVPLLAQARLDHLRSLDLSEKQQEESKKEET